ncbi:Oidioi.mRNA.OKI2018_I69.chr2.g4163.t1.cds [Oikopleura dioica]|uniref:Oidioi.mRNA.OKI2018_I69.chr2.g4163.t1.cds n=1 Tax=Oikopleura dioica TaxID=34765 RepID=A0ABN7T2W3_OIKDI|nr:Oidioi.mRNA.OKI2018_I69.chr2.g4163.t1.cds [Oikopleura dioica]
MLRNIGRIIARTSAVQIEAERIQYIREVLFNSVSTSTRQKFEAHDKFDDGQVPIRDLYKIFSEDTKGLENFVENLVGQVQVNTQNMTFPDFLILMSQRKGVSSPLHPVRDLFKSYDIEENGAINAAELKEWMWSHGKLLTQNQAQALIDKIDQKEDGVIDYTEFLLVVARKILTSEIILNVEKQDQEASKIDQN